MLFFKVSAQCLLLSGMQAIVLADPIPSNLREVREESAPADLQILSGSPLMFDEKRAVEFEAGFEERDEDDEERGLFARGPNADQLEALRLHNVARKSKNLKPLVWDPKLRAAARVWAKYLAVNGKFEHSTGDSRPGQGENLAYSWSTGKITNPITGGTKAWLAEEKDYNNEIIPQGDFAAYGHYTQCLWNATTKVGIATYSNGKGAYYTVARYKVAGNVVGQRPYNVVKK